MKYWDLVKEANIDLCLLLLGVKVNVEENKSDGKKIDEWNKLTEDFKTIWKKAGSPGKIAAEKEHFQFLTVSFYSAKNPLQTTLNKINAKNPEGADDLENKVAALRAAFDEAVGKSAKRATGRRKTGAKKLLNKKK